MSEHTFETILCWGDEREASVEITYATHAGYAGDRIDPPEPASVEITKIKWLNGDHDIPERFGEDAALLEECMRDWAEWVEAAQEQRAEMRAEMLAEDRQP